MIYSKRHRLNSALGYINIDVLEQHLSAAIMDFLDDVSQEKVLVTNQVNLQNNCIYTLAPIESPKGTVFKLIFPQYGIDE